MQAVPLPYDQVSLQRDGAEIARYHFGPALHRPFVFPVVGPAGQCLTRMGHPHDPVGHSHHNSVWISHFAVNGVDFWGDTGKGRIVHKRVEQLDDGSDHASVQTFNEWIDGPGTPLLHERRRITVRTLPQREWFLILDLQLEASGGKVTFGKTPFGLIGVRLARTIGVNDGGGIICNSEGGVNEPEVLWKRAKWVDYSGPILTDRTEGITLMDHPANPNHPTFFHVRNDGWMGASLTYDAPRTLHPGQPLLLRYGLYVHAGTPSPSLVLKRWEEFTRAPRPPLHTK
jgi:hypothetical protein